MKLSIGMSHYDDFDGVWFTIQSIRNELLANGMSGYLEDIEFVIVENNKGSKHSDLVQKFATEILSKDSLRYSICRSKGTSACRNQIFKEATGDFVLVLDCHVLLFGVANIIRSIFDFIDYNPDVNDIYSGPLVHENGKMFSTHMRNKWNDKMWGVWGTAVRSDCGDWFDAYYDNGSPFVCDLVTGEKIETCPNCNKGFFEGCKLERFNERHEDYFQVFAQGLGCFFVRRLAWLGFNENAKGFGGEEGYIHEKYRKEGHRATCLPFLKWLHRFQRVEQPDYPLSLEYKVRNYILEFAELGLDLDIVYNYFVKELGFDEILFESFVNESKYFYPDRSE